MPVIHLPFAYLERLTGTDRRTILERLPMMGSDIERTDEDRVDVEFFPSRPDLFSTEGVARAMRGFLGLETGLPAYPVAPGPVRFSIDPALARIRPYLGSAVIRNVSLDNEGIESLMGLQEALHWAVGRGRAKVAIGVHDLVSIKPPFRYIASPTDRAFVPLDYPDEEMTLEEILEHHPKGRDYAKLVRGFDRYPLIVDAEDRVLSFPPIINGELTRVTDDTTDILLDCTGTDERAVCTAVNIICTAFAEAGAIIERVDIDGTVWPDLAPVTRTVRTQECSRLLGFDLSSEELAGLLERMRFGAAAGSDGTVEVQIPCYRADIMHDWDVFEDVAIAYGYDRVRPILPETFTVGAEHPAMPLLAAAREIFVGLGYLETMPFTLTNERVLYTQMRRETNPGVLPVAHPISEEHTVLRTDLMPLLLETLQANLHRELPQRLFAAGDVVEDLKTHAKTACVAMHPAADFSEIYAVVDVICREFSLSWEAAESSDEAFIPGRRADVLVGGKIAGVFGEVHPAVLNAFALDQPVAGFELDLRAVLRRRGQPGTP